MASLHEMLMDSTVLRELRLGAISFDDALRVVDWKGFLAPEEKVVERHRNKPLTDELTPYFLSRGERDAFFRRLSGVLLSEKQSEAWDVEVKFPGMAGRHFRCILYRGLPNQLLFKPTEAAELVRERYERIFDSTPDGIMVIDTGRRVRLVNKACGELLGKNPQDVLQNNCVCGQMVNCHLADGTSLDSQLCPAMELFEGEIRFQVETMLATNSRGEERWIETTYSPIRKESGEVEFVIGILRDVHDRVALEQRVRQSEKLASLGELTAGIAHEIKNPLGILLSSVEIILDPNRPSSMKEEAALFIKDEVKRLDDRLRGFLKFARPTPPHRVKFSLNEMVQRFFRDHGRERSPFNTLMLWEDGPLMIDFDEDHLQQILVNLYVNALEAGGEDVAILVKTIREESGIYLELHDGGPGIPEANRTKIFNPFFTTDAKGTGLGLSIVFQLVSANGGEIGVDRSELLGGAMFRVRLAG
ncbi:MAG: PAS domain S-box protein [Candidatus Sumerlaeia bacterium]|nr:PAS domain S-box protein [Candidatus Sumerlaeia bacterium]